MIRHTYFRLLAFAAGFVIMPAVAQHRHPQAELRKDKEVTVELNKLEAVNNACRGYFLITNGLADDLKELRLDVFLFDKTGIILRRIGLTFPDIQAGRSRVVLFDIPGLGCGDIGRMMINDVLTCTTAGGSPLQECARAVTTRTRAEAEFTY